MPRSVICVAGEAKWPPGIGNTYTGGGPLGFGAGAGFAGGFLVVFALAPGAAIRQRRTASPSANANAA